MGGRIQGSVQTGVGYPVQRPDRGLYIWFAWWPESQRDEDVMFGSWAIDPWPIRSGHLNGEQETGIRPFTNRVVWVEDIRNSGSTNRPYHITGYVKDNGGNPVSGATVNLVKVASQNSPFDDYIVDRQLSQEDGLYDFEVEDTTTLYYVEAFQASPAKAGMTSRTLVGA